MKNFNNKSDVVPNKRSKSQEELEEVARLNSTSAWAEAKKFSFWYKEEMVAAVLTKLLHQADLQLSHVQRNSKGQIVQQNGIILTAENKPYKTLTDDGIYSISLAEPLLISLTVAWEGAMLDLLHNTIKECLDWNRDKKLQGANNDLLSTHTILVPLNHSNIHWVLATVNVSIAQHFDNFYIEKCLLTVYDSLSVLKISNAFIDRFKTILKNLLPGSLKVVYECPVKYVNVLQQPDGNACGVLTTETARNIIFGKEILVGPKDGVKAKYTFEEIKQIRLEHMRILNDPQFFMSQVNDASITINSLGLKQEDGFLKVANAIYNCIITESQEEQDKLYIWIEEYFRASIILEHLNKLDTKYEPETKDLNLLDKYLDKYEKYKVKYSSTFNEAFVENGSEKLIFCANESCRENLEQLKIWMVKHKEKLQEIWPMVLKDFADKDGDWYWVDDGQDKFVSALNELLACKASNIRPRQTEAMPLLTAFKASSSVDGGPVKLSDTLSDIPMDSDANLEMECGSMVSAAKLQTFKFASLRNNDPECEVNTGYISCVLGDEFNNLGVEFNNIEDTYLCYVGDIVDGCLHGLGTLFVYNLNLGNIYYLNGTFDNNKLQNDGIETNFDDDTDKDLILLGIEKHLLKHAHDHRMSFPAKVAASSVGLYC